MFGILGEKRRYIKKQRGKGIPFGFIASAAPPILGEIAKPLLKKIFGGRRRRRKR